jgi:hypothetical protein
MVTLQYDSSAMKKKEIVDIFNYLGLVFTSGDSFRPSTMTLAAKVFRAVVLF